MIKNIILVFVLILIVLFSGCIGKPQGGVDIEYFDEAIKQEIELPEKTLSNQAIRMTVYLTNQVENDVNDVRFSISDLYGLKITNVKCAGEYKTDNFCYFPSIQSLDEKEIGFSLRVPADDELAYLGRNLNPEFTLEYNYSGQTMFYVPILKEKEKSTEAKMKSTQSYGPIHVNIERSFTQSNNDWEREGNIFSIIVDVTDVLKSDNELEINKDNFRLYLTNLETGSEWGRCDFDSVGEYYTPSSNIKLPMKTPLVCALKAKENLPFPRVDGIVRVEYSYTYKTVEKKSISVETKITD